MQDDNVDTRFTPSDSLVAVSIDDDTGDAIVLRYALDLSEFVGWTWRRHKVAVDALPGRSRSMAAASRRAWARCAEASVPCTASGAARSAMVCAMLRARDKHRLVEGVAFVRSIQPNQQDVTVPLKRHGFEVREWIS
jgi:hypothetical protein